MCNSDHELFSSVLKDIRAYSEKDIEDLKDELLNAKMSKYLA